MSRASMKLAAICVLAVFVDAVAAADPSDFGLQALQRAKESYVAGDPAAARRSLVEATGVLASLAESMGAPGRGEVWMLVNDLRLLRLAPGDVDPRTLHGLTEAETRADGLARRYPDGSGMPATLR
jgi:hypothetical protein